MTTITQPQSTEKFDTKPRLISTPLLAITCITIMSSHQSRCTNPGSRHDDTADKDISTAVIRVSTHEKLRCCHLGLSLRLCRMSACQVESKHWMTPPYSQNDEAREPL